MYTFIQTTNHNTSTHNDTPVHMTSYRTRDLFPSANPSLTRQKGGASLPALVLKEENHRPPPPPIPIILNMSDIFGMPPPRPPRPPIPFPICDIIPGSTSQYQLVCKVQGRERCIRTLHLLHIELVAPLPAHHRLHHLLQAPTTHLALHLLQHARGHSALAK